MCKQKTKKVYRFLQQKKKKIDVHTVNKKKKSKESTQILTIRKKKND